MRDFALCTDAGCPSRKSCRRFTDEPRDTRQNYADFQRGDKPNCWMFEPVSRDQSDVPRLEKADG